MGMGRVFSSGDAMTDRENLEAAAKAAGIALWTGSGGAWSENHQGLLLADGYTMWRPLTDDGDALRLAVKLNIPVIPYDDETSTGTVGVVAKNWGSKEANTRRAIVRAAAAIGRGTP